MNYKWIRRYWDYQSPSGPHYSTTKTIFFSPFQILKNHKIAQCWDIEHPVQWSRGVKRNIRCLIYTWNMKKLPESNKSFSTSGANFLFFMMILYNSWFGGGKDTPSSSWKMIQQRIKGSLLPSNFVYMISVADSMGHSHRFCFSGD